MPSAPDRPMRGSLRQDGGYLTVRLSHDDLRRLRALATSDERSLSGMARVLIRRGLTGASSASTPSARVRALPTVAVKKGA